MRDPNSDPRRFDSNPYADRLRQISGADGFDHPNLAPFAARGGKLVIGGHLADHAQSPYASIEYYRAVVARLGQERTDSCLHLCLTPGADHVGTGAPVSVDMLDVLDDWIEKGTAPQDLVQVSRQPAAPSTKLASRPMCRYPGLPKYRGQGDQNRAASFACEAACQAFNGLSSARVRSPDIADRCSSAWRRGRG